MLADTDRSRRRAIRHALKVVTPEYLRALFRNGYNDRPENWDWNLDAVLRREARKAHDHPTPA